MQTLDKIVYLVNNWSHHPIYRETACPRIKNVVDMIVSMQDKFSKILKIDMMQLDNSKVPGKTVFDLYMANRNRCFLPLSSDGMCTIAFCKREINY